MADWADLILRTGVEHGFWPDDRHIVIDEGRLRPGVTDVMALRVGYEKLNRETGWEPKVSWEEGVLRTIQWYAEHRDRWIGRVDWLGPRARRRPRDARPRERAPARRRARRPRRHPPPPRRRAGRPTTARRWEDEAAEDHVRSAIAAGETDRSVDLRGADRRRSRPLWDRDSRAAPTLRHRARDRRRLRADPALPRAASATSRGRPTARSTSPRRCCARLRRVPRAASRPGNCEPLYRDLRLRRRSCRSQDDSVDIGAHERRLPAHGQELRRARRRARSRACCKPGGHVRLRRLVPERAQPGEPAACRLKPKRLRARRTS